MWLPDLLVSGPDCLLQQSHTVASRTHTHTQLSYVLGVSSLAGCFCAHRYVCLQQSRPRSPAAATTVMMACGVQSCFLEPVQWVLIACGSPCRRCPQDLTLHTLLGATYYACRLGCAGQRGFACAALTPLRCVFLMMFLAHTVQCRALSCLVTCTTPLHSTHNFNATVPNKQQQSAKSHCTCLSADHKLMHRDSLLFHATHTHTTRQERRLRRFG